MNPDWIAEIIPNEPKAVSYVPDGTILAAYAADDPIYRPKAPIDVTGRVQIDDIGSVSRSVERDLLSFRTGDLTLSLDDADGYLTDLFALFSPTDRWQFRLIRNRVTQFAGVILGIGSVSKNERSDRISMTVFGMTRVLSDASAENVRRSADVIYLTSGVSAGVRTLTVNDTSALRSGDSVRIRSEADQQTTTVQRVISGTQFKIEDDTTASFTGGASSTNPVTIVELKTPFHRYESVEYLVRALFEAAGVPMVEYTMTGSKLSGIGPYKCNRDGLPDDNVQISPAMEQSGVTYITIDANGTYKQTDPEDAWTQSDSSDKIWVDWSRYRTLAQGEPSILLRCPDGIKDAIFGDEWQAGFDFENSPFSMWVLQNDGATDRLRKRTTTDGTTWAAVADVAALQGEALGDLVAGGCRGCEYDPVRDLVYVWYELDNGNLHSWVWDNSGSSWTQLQEADDVTDGTFYFGFVYVPEKDYTLAMRSVLSDGPVFQIAAWRGTTRLWKRDFARCLIRSESSEAYHYPSRTIRYIDGHLCGVLSQDGDLKFFWTDDEFQNLNIGSLSITSKVTRTPTGVVNGRFRIFASEEAAPASNMNVHWFVAESTANIRPDYADFTDKTVAEALSDLATLVNATFWVDDDLQGHFVARDLLTQAPEIIIDDYVLERSTVRHWDEVKTQITVSSDSVSAIGGSVSAPSESVTIQNGLVPNEAFALSVAKGAAAFFSKDRRMVEVTVDVSDGTVYELMQRVNLDGVRWLIYELSVDIGSDEAEMTLLEDV